MKSIFISDMLSLSLKVPGRDNTLEVCLQKKDYLGCVNIFSIVLLHFQTKFSSEASEYHRPWNTKLQLKAANQSSPNPSLFLKYLWTFIINSIKVSIFFSTIQCRCLLKKIRISKSTMGLALTDPFCYQAMICFLKSHIGHEYFVCLLVGWLFFFSSFNTISYFIGDIGISFGGCKSENTVSRMGFIHSA